MRVSREVVRVAGQHARAGLDQDHPRALGVDVAEVRRQRVARQFGDGAGELDAGRPGADDREGQQRRPAVRVGLEFGALEGEQDPAADHGRVLEGLQAGRERFPFVMAEIGVARARAEDERVVGHGLAPVEQDAPRLGIDADDRGQHRRHLGAPAHDPADRPGDLREAERRGGGLVEQGLEQVVVAPVDQRHPDRRPGQALHGGEAAEPGADDDDMVGCGAAPVRIGASAEVRLGHGRTMSQVMVGCIMPGFDRDAARESPPDCRRYGTAAVSAAST